MDGSGLEETALKAGELLTAVEMPEQAKPCQVFLKQRVRRSVDFALSSVALAVTTANGICEAIRLVLGGVAPAPVLVPMDGFIGRKFDQGVIEDAADASIQAARPLRSNGYKVELTRATVQRAFAGLGL
jgi:xanthine dehydrogenase YagS FAD-binding subunit